MPRLSTQLYYQPFTPRFSVSIWTSVFHLFHSPKEKKMPITGEFALDIQAISEPPVLGGGMLGAEQGLESTGDHSPFPFAAFGLTLPRGSEGL